MLPTEAFADAIVFLRLFDLSALAVTSALCSSLAVKASTAIRWEEFSGFQFILSGTQLGIITTNEDPDKEELVAWLHFPDGTAIAEFVADAFPNCTFDDILIPAFGIPSLYEAFVRVVDSVVVKGTIRFPDTMSLHQSLGLIRKFRKVQTLELKRQNGQSHEKMREIAEAYRGSGVQEIHYSYPYPYSKVTKITLT